MAQTGDRNEGDIEAELRPYVNRSLAPHAWRGSAIRARNAARWREARAEPLPRLDGDALLARTEARILTFWQGDRAEDAAPARWPLSDAQREAIRGAARATSGAQRLRAVADILEASAYFCWFASAEALDGRELRGGERFYRAFYRPDLGSGTYTKANVGLIGPKEPPIEANTPVAVCADARGWAALLWAHPRNRWGWETLEANDFFPMEPDRERSSAFAAARESGELIGVTNPCVGVSFFTSLSAFDGVSLNAGAGRLLGLDEAQAQWLGASAWEGGPYWDEHVTGQDMAAVCRAVARGEDARDAWYARRIAHLSLQGHYPSFPREDESAQGPLDRTPAFAERPSTLISHALGVARTLDRGTYRANARVLHRWNASLGACEVDLAGMLLAGEVGIAPHASADAVWAHMLRREGMGCVLRALREIGIGDVHDAAVTLGCWDAELRHREALETLTRRLQDLDL